MSATEFSSAVVGHLDYLKGVALQLTRFDGQRANDLIQDTVLKALDNREKYREDRNLKSWLAVIMRNLFINGFRKSYTYKTRIQSEEPEVLKRRSITENNIQQEVVEQEVDTALSEMPSMYSKPIWLYFSGFSYDEIGSELDIPAAKVKSRIYAGRQHLRKRLAPYRLDPLFL